MGFYKKVLIALISSLTLYVGNVYNLPQYVCVWVGGGGLSGPSDHPFLRPLLGLHRTYE